MHLRLSLIFTFIIYSKIFTVAQGLTQTPYSQFGLGDIEMLSNVRVMGMGGTGVSMAIPASINFKNPAITAFNRSYVTFEGGFYGQNLNIQSETKSQRITNGNIQYLALLIPVTAKNWTISFGMAPYSNANSRFFTESRVNGDSATIRYDKVIEGGLTQVFFSNGVRIAKGFSLGLTTAYVFGNISRKNIGTLNLTDQATTTQVVSKEIYRLLEFKPGAYYYTKLANDLLLNIGATANFSTNLSSKRELTNSISSLRTGLTLYSDTIVNLLGSASLPISYNAGLSLDKLNKWTIGIDYTYSSYANYKSFAPVNAYVNSQRISIGGEYTPLYNAIRGYHKRILYRGGVFYSTGPISIEGTKITDLGASLGFGLPMSKGGVGMINLAFMAGQRGTTDHNLIQETYFRFFLGVTINDRWFLRYKVD